MKKAENLYHFFFYSQVVTPGTLSLTKVSIFVTRTVMKQAGDVHTQTECQHALVSHWLSQWHRQTRQDQSRPDSCDLMSLYEADDRSMANHQTWHKKISFPSKELHHLERATGYDGTKDCIGTNTFWPNHSSIRNESNLWQVWHTLISSIEIKLEKEALSFCVSELCLVSTMKVLQNVHSLRFEKSCSKEFSSADRLDASWRSLSQITALTNFFAAHSARCY